MNRICPECGFEILPELNWLHGGDEVVDLASVGRGEIEQRWKDGDPTLADVEASIVLSCRCSSYGFSLSGRVLAFGLPDEWEYEEED